MLPPSPGIAVLRRPRLLAMLGEGLEHPERRGTAILAGAGYGKTTLAASFLHESPIQSVWYSLDPSDRDPYVFFRYVIDVVRRRCAEFGRLAEELLKESSVFAGDAGVDRFVD